MRAEVGWAVLEPVRLAVLDHGLVTRMVPMAGTRGGVVRPGDPAGPPPGGGAGHRPPPAGRRPGPADLVARRRTMGDGSAGTASSSTCRSPTSAWLTWSAPTGRRSPRLWGTWCVRGRSAGGSRASGYCMGRRRAAARPSARRGDDLSLGDAAGAVDARRQSEPGGRSPMREPRPSEPVPRRGPPGRPAQTSPPVWRAGLVRRALRGGCRRIRRSARGEIRGARHLRSRRVR